MTLSARGGGEQVSEPFFRPKELNKGTVPGLATAYTIFLQQRKPIQYDSQLDASKTFTVRLHLQSHRSCRVRDRD